MTGNDEVRGALSAEEVAALERLESLLRDEPNVLTTDDCRALCAALRRLQSPPSVSGEWIAVSERLPEDTATVFICYADDDEPDIQFAYYADGWRYNDGSDLLMRREVACWCRFPTPPTTWPPHAAPVSNEGDSL